MRISYKVTSNKPCINRGDTYVLLHNKFEKKPKKPQPPPQKKKKKKKN